MTGVSPNPEKLSISTVVIQVTQLLDFKTSLFHFHFKFLYIGQLHLTTVCTEFSPVQLGRRYSGKLGRSR